MTRAADLVLPAAIGSVASIGAIVVGPPGLGVTGLVVCGGLFVLGMRDAQAIDAERRREAMREDQRQANARAAAAKEAARPTLEHKVLRHGPAPHDITPEEARQALREFFRDPRNSRVRTQLRNEFRSALATTEYYAHQAGEKLTAHQWIHRARGRLARAGLLP